MPTRSRAQPALYKEPLHGERPGASEKAGAEAAGPGTLYLLHSLTHATRSRLDDALRPLGLTSFHYTVLSVVQHNEGLSSSRLSRRFHVSPQSMGEVIALLESRGLLLRTEEAGNRRIRRLSLTAAGQDATATAQAAVHTIEGEVFAPLSPRQLSELRSLALRLLAGLRCGT